MGTPAIEIRRMVVLGAGGDLAARLLLPGLAGLLHLGKLPEGFTLVGVDRPDWDDATFQKRVFDAVTAHGDASARKGARALADACSFVHGDAADPAAVTKALAEGEGPAVIYLALPPPVFGAAITAIGRAGLPADSAIVIEKPFGHDLKSAQGLNALLAKAAPERAVHRIDHFLEKQTVQNILGIRFANRVFEPLWNRHHVERIEIVWDEDLALEGRAGYYDNAGALRDMIQNHLLQVMALVAMERPKTINEHDLRDKKVEVLKAVRIPTPDEIATQTIRARYTAGTAADGPVPSYADELGIDASKGTETFAAVTLHVDSPRWQGVPFVLRTGKALGGLRQHIAIRFRAAPHLTFGQQEAPRSNVLMFALSPDRLELHVAINGEGDFFDLEPVTLVCNLAPQDVTAYGRVILDVLHGDPTLSIRGDEAEECWRIVEPILAEWAKGNPPLEEYPAGSEGPAGAEWTEAIVPPATCADAEQIAP